MKFHDNLMRSLSITSYLAEISGFFCRIVVLVVVELDWAVVEVDMFLFTCVVVVGILGFLGILLEIIFTNTKLDLVFALADAKRFWQRNLVPEISTICPRNLHCEDSLLILLAAVGENQSEIYKTAAARNILLEQIVFM
jgi:hypothetical protein